MRSNILRIGFVGVLSSILLAEALAQDFPVVPEKTQDAVFEKYVGAIDNAQRIHEIGFQATMIFDYDVDRKSDSTPKTYRRYGTVADIGNGKFRRIENVGWTIGESGVSWEQGARLICNDSGAYMQQDPAAIRKIDKDKVNPGIRIHMQSIYSPFGLLWSTINGVVNGQATTTAITRCLEAETKLVDAKIHGSKIECLYIFNDRGGALSVTFDQDQGGMPVEVKSLLRDKKFQGLDKLGPLTKIDPEEISQWFVSYHGMVSWSKVTDSKEGDLWFPTIIDLKERGPGSIGRGVYYFVDWKIGRDVDKAIFGHKQFEKTHPNTNYAEVEVSHEYMARQKELDEKALSLRKKFKLE